MTPNDVEKLEGKLTKLEARTTIVEARLADVRHLLWWVLGLIVAGAVGTNLHITLSR